MPDQWLADCVADINICFTHEMLSNFCPSDVDKRTPIGSTPMPVFGRGVVKMCMGHYVDHDGMCYPLDLEIEDI